MKMYRNLLPKSYLPDSKFVWTVPVSFDQTFLVEKKGSVLLVLQNIDNLF